MRRSAVWLFGGREIGHFRQKASRRRAEGERQASGRRAAGERQAVRRRILDRFAEIRGLTAHGSPRTTCSWAREVTLTRFDRRSDPDSNCRIDLCKSAGISSSRHCRIDWISDRECRSFNVFAAVRWPAILNKIRGKNDSDKL